LWLGREPITRVNDRSYQAHSKLIKREKKEKKEKKDKKDKKDKGHKRDKRDKTEKRERGADSWSKSPPIEVSEVVPRATPKKLTFRARTGPAPPEPADLD
jgi:hypothetical protein